MFLSAPAAALPAEALLVDPALDADAALWGVVLAGGIGSRFWPLSSPERPKPLLTLISERPLIAESVARLAPLIPPERVLVVTSRDIAPAIANAIPEVPAGNILVEPRPLGTAAAVAWAAHELARRAGPETIGVCSHCDLAIAFPDAFRHALRDASRVAARHKLLVAIGAPAIRGETGFGYITPGAPISDLGATEQAPPRLVARYEEKPAIARARQLASEGAFWNAGVSVWRAAVMLDELTRHTLELAPGWSALADGDHESFASAINSVSIERGLFERTDAIAVVAGEFGWDDVGTWASLRRARELDDDGNGLLGHTYCCDASANIVHAEASTVVLYGVSGLLVVSIDGLTFVTTVEKAADLKPLMDSLPAQRPWQSGA